ncbi:hypothetical protein U8C32_08460 [Sinorhizobium medicae]|nr:hypothetical protein [Sinorhizobium medicae]UFX04040.1 hypothetical protein SmedWSM1115_06250 [Sinorhizobium medicae WSM1115]UWU09908.1 hypothetical protein N2598_05950 [Sinorhizobium medicae]WQO47310.1 hypothetical protein U8C42_08505 [Sinorhizobium medicae]WQO53939.1 hypothetical protein U8C36_08595 [Sinorhizobium medicae]WQO87719.1 hypothetical protein U8C37_08500 [Sinorhizobium medicae]
MDQLPPHRCRTRQPFEPRPERYRHHSLRYPQHRGPLLPLTGRALHSLKTAPSGAVFVSWKRRSAVVGSRA